MATQVAATQVSIELQLNPLLQLSAEEFMERAVVLTEQFYEQEECDALVTDTSVGADEKRRIFTIDMVVLSDEPFIAVAHVSAYLRTVLHAVGETTPGWPSAEDIERVVKSSQMQTERTLVTA